MVYYFEWHSVPETFLSSSMSPPGLNFILNDDLFVGRDALQPMQQSFVSIISGELLDLRSASPKAFFAPGDGIFHINIDSLSKIFSVLSTTDYSVVIDTKFLKLNDQLPGKKVLFDYFETVISFFNSKFDNRILMFNSHEIDGYLINNYALVDSYYKATTAESIQAFSLIKEAFGIKDDISETNKKVYLSRRMVHKRGPYGKDVEVQNPNFPPFRMDDRILNEEVLEEFFASNGFEVVVPELFESAIDQIKFFGNVTTLVSVTSSGIANSIFMPQQSNILEIVTSFIVESSWNNPDETIGAKLMEVLHNQYGPLSYLLNQNYARIPNFYRDSYDIIDRIKSNKSILGFLGIEND